MNLSEKNQKVSEITGMWVSKDKLCPWCDGDGEHNKQRIFHAKGQQCEWCKGTGLAENVPLDFTSDTGFARLVDWLCDNKLTDKGWFASEALTEWLRTVRPKDNIRLALIDAVIMAEGGGE